jgi:hypothetical protein
VRGFQARHLGKVSAFCLAGRQTDLFPLALYVAHPFLVIPAPDTSCVELLHSGSDSDATRPGNRPSPGHVPELARILPQPTLKQGQTSSSIRANRPRVVMTSSLSTGNLIHRFRGCEPRDKPKPKASNRLLVLIIIRFSPPRWIAHTFGCTKYSRRYLALRILGAHQIAIRSVLFSFTLRDLPIPRTSLNDHAQHIHVRITRM